MPAAETALFSALLEDLFWLVAEGDETAGMGAGFVGDINGTGFAGVWGAGVMAGIRGTADFVRVETAARTGGDGVVWRGRDAKEKDNSTERGPGNFI